MAQGVRCAHADSDRYANGRCRICSAAQRARTWRRKKTRTNREQARIKAKAGCSGRRGYLTEKGAKTMADMQRGRSGADYWIYLCDCGRYHVERLYG